jgi:hypothetical protein
MFSKYIEMSKSFKKSASRFLGIDKSKDFKPTDVIIMKQEQEHAYTGTPEDHYHYSYTVNGIQSTIKINGKDDYTGVELIIEDNVRNGHGQKIDDRTTVTYKINYGDITINGKPPTSGSYIPLSTKGGRKTRRNKSRRNKKSRKTNKFFFF